MTKPSDVLKTSDGYLKHGDDPRDISFSVVVVLLVSIPLPAWMGGDHDAEIAGRPVR